MLTVLSSEWIRILAIVITGSCCFFTLIRLFILISKGE